MMSHFRFHFNMMILCGELLLILFYKNQKFKLYLRKERKQAKSKTYFKEEEEYYIRKII